jgi:phage FluMu protein Com
MAEAQVDAGYEVECPHCRKTFRAEPMLGDAARYRGFKCPHCKLFVPLDRSGATAEPRP